MARTLVHEYIDNLFENPNQPRENFGLAELALLEESLFIRQESPSRHY